MQAVSISSSTPPSGAPANPQPQPASRDDGGFGQVMRALSDRPSEPFRDSARSDGESTETAGPDALAAQAEGDGDMTVLDLLSPDLPVADTPNPDDQPEADVIVATELFSLLLSGAVMAARFPPTAFAVTQGVTALLASAGPQAGTAIAGEGAESTSLSGPQVSAPDAADGIPAQTRPQGLPLGAGDMRGPEPPPLAMQPGPAPGASADAAIPARISLPRSDPGTAFVPEQLGAVPAAFTFRSTDPFEVSDPAGSDAGPEGTPTTPPAPTVAPGSAVPTPGLAAGSTPLADLPALVLPSDHPDDPAFQFGAPQSLIQAAPTPLHQGPGVSFVPPPLAATLSDLLMRRSDGPVELTLSPEELGRVRLSLSPDGDGLHVTVQVERGDTLDLLRRNSDLLLQEIRAQGFSGATFSFSGWAGDRPEHRAQPGPDAPRPVLSSGPATSAPPGVSSPAAGLDLRL